MSICTWRPASASPLSAPLAPGKEHALAPVGRAGCAQQRRKIRVQGQLLSNLGEAARGALRNRALGFVYQFTIYCQNSPRWKT